MRYFYDPTPECIEELKKPWIAAYSGGKDSTSLVTWLEYLRRTEQIVCEQPRLVMSNTGVEFPFLREIGQRMMACLRSSGWECTEVRPELRDRLYVQIFGRGSPPIDPAIKNMRWCTRATKVDPMKRFRRGLGDLIQLTGSRWNESSTRDGKLQRAGCSAGGECGTNFTDKDDRAEHLYSPIVNWRTCQVVDWLNGEGEAIYASPSILDLLDITADLIKIYGINKGDEGFGMYPPEVHSLRFGCIGCPAVGVNTGGANFRGIPEWSHLLKLWGIWTELRRFSNRCGKMLRGKWRVGPIKMEVRKRYFPMVLDIQQKSGVEIVTKEDVTFIEECWRNKVYPRGWSEADESNRKEDFIQIGFSRLEKE